MLVRASLLLPVFTVIACASDREREDPSTTVSVTLTLGSGTEVGESAVDESIGETASFDIGSALDFPGGGPAKCTDTSAQALTSFVPCALPIALVAPYDDDYECWQYVDVPGIPPEYGGMLFALDDPDLLLIGGAANVEAGQLFAIRVTRDQYCNVTGFSDPTAVLFSAAEYNDGGIAYAGDGVMFLARWPVNELGQLVRGAMATSKVIDMTAAGVASPDQGTAALAFVPGGFPGEGLFKLVTWSGGYWYTVALASDGAGTYDVSSVTQEVILPGGPEGFVYVGNDSPEVDAPSLLVADWSENTISIYEVDGEGDPVLDTRTLFVTGLQGPEGAHIDPQSGNFLFSTFGGGNVLIAIRGFAPNMPPPPPG